MQWEDDSDVQLRQFVRRNVGANLIESLCVHCSTAIHATNKNALQAAELAHSQFCRLKRFGGERGPCSPAGSYDN
jgi:hypothetical protein